LLLAGPVAGLVVAGRPGRGVRSGRCSSTRGPFVRAGPRRVRAADPLFVVVCSMASCLHVLADPSLRQSGRRMAESARCIG
jgi:hypothetical protein